MNSAGAAYEAAVRFTHAKHFVTRALSLPETWVIIVSILYMFGHFAYWAGLSFRVAGR